MKNVYMTSYFPILSLFLYSLSLAVSFEFKLLPFLKEIGLYSGMLEFFSDGGIKLALLILLTIMFFMVFAALKIIADTINELSLLFFSNETEGRSLNKIRFGSAIYFFTGAISLLVSFYSLLGVLAIFVLATIGYLVYFIFNISGELTIAGIFGLVFFQVLIWSSLIFGVIFVAMKVYNSVLHSLSV